MYGFAAPKTAQMTVAQCKAKWESKSVHGSHVQSSPTEETQQESNELTDN